VTKAKLVILLMLAKCPCCEGTNVIWEGWTGKGACKVHGLKLEEVAFGYQLQWKDCKTAEAHEARDNEGPGYCWATTSPYFWHQHKHREIPRELNWIAITNLKTGDMPYFVSIHAHS
jgi:hypothetical protein